MVSVARNRGRRTDRPPQAEHRSTTTLIDLVGEEIQRRQVDFSQHVSFEPHTEVGHIAVEYNRMLTR